MNIVDQIKQLIGINPPLSHSPSLRPETNSLREALEAGQRAKRAENFPLALEAFEHATRLAISLGDTGAIAVIALNQAEVYVEQNRLDDAAALLQKTYQTSKEARQRSLMAYMLGAEGHLAQVRGQWEVAQKWFEQALEMTQGTRASGAEGRAQGYLADNYLHENNSSYAVRLLREALPKLNMSGDIELSTYFVGRLGEALIGTGQTGEGHQLIERALKLANQLGYRRYQRRWGLLLAERASAEGRMDEAQKYLHDSLPLFNSDNPNAEHVRALCAASKIEVSLREIPAAREYAHQAVELSLKLEDEMLRAQAQAALGHVLIAGKDYADAAPVLESAVDTYARLTRSDLITEELELLRNLAVAYAETGDDTRAVSTYQRALKRASQADLPLEVAQTYRDTGLFYARRDRMQDAIREWSSALVVYENNNQPAQAARLYCDLGAARKYLGQGIRAMKEYEHALMLLSNVNDDWETRGLVLSNAAVAYADQGDMDTTESFFSEAITLSRRLNSETAESVRRGNYGWFLLATGRPQQAVSTLEYALRLSERPGMELQHAIQTDNLGLAHDAQANYPQALQQHQKALELIKPLHSAHWENSITVNIARTHLALGEVALATPLLQEALAQARSHEDVEMVIKCLIELARLALLENRPADATPLLDEAVGTARRADMRRLQADALGLYSEQQAALNQVDRAAALWDEASKLFAILRSPQSKIQPAWLKTQSSV